MQEKILILDFGSQYTQLIARRIRELNVYCEIFPFNHYPTPDNTVKGVILSGSPSSVRDVNAPFPDLKPIKGRIPLLGVCYGAQHLTHNFGGEVLPSDTREYGRARLVYADVTDDLFKGISERTQVWMSHGDTIAKIPEDYKIIGSTEDVKVGAFRINDEQTWGIQFHPEVYHTTEGLKILGNFVNGICGCKADWTPESFVEMTVRSLKETLGNDKVVLGLSGGVDSSVAALLLDRSIGANLTSIFVDNGLLRKDEYA
ncbi:MAG: glutamine-hydrolyzing GMP synthase, partial [Bacteroidales bacterium]|nr:glutamine-hydrolyzing GMP synthase [Bacteroidales bacterium]